MYLSVLLHWMAKRIKGLCPLSANNWFCANLFRQAGEVTGEIKITIHDPVPAQEKTTNWVSSKSEAMVLVMNDFVRWSFVEKRKYPAD
jgi:hypothetical protein